MVYQEPLFSEQVDINIPVALSLDLVRNNCKISQLFCEPYSGQAEAKKITGGKFSWQELRLPSGHTYSLFEHGSPVPDGFGPHLRRRAGDIEWVDVRSQIVDSNARDAAVDSWTGKFTFRQEDETNAIRGLWQPQLGSVHAIHAHWSVTDEPATVVMPTGTGKTETMLATLVSSQCQRVLDIVPSQVLRDQLFGKFLSLGLLKQLGVLDSLCKTPVVAKMRGSLATAQAVDEVFGVSNVVIAVINSVAMCSGEALQRISELCSHLFIDEAHHVPATTWSRVKSAFVHRRVVQFTATPYRNDGKRVDGKMIYFFPLLKAQEQGYFKQIQYKPVLEFLPEASNRSIATAAVSQLRMDLEHGHDHILMARGDPIDRLEALLPLYEELGSEYKPVIIHSRLTKPAREEALRLLRGRESRIALCDNMLGEGFDFPQLKVAALHDIHKSLAVSLQFTGRFTRAAGLHLGPATMIANAALSSVTGALRELYAQDADWNKLIQEMADFAVGARVRSSEFSDSFRSYGADFPAENIRPKMSAVVYRTHCDKWDPTALSDWLAETQVFAGPSISDEFQTAFFITKEYSEVEWGLAKEAADITYTLYLLHWDSEQQLLYINGTDNTDLHSDLAKVVAGESAERIYGEPVYRALYGVNRLLLINLGLKSVFGRSIRFSMLAGADVLEGITPASAGTKTKTNLFALGYESGERATVGCSLKGRLWSYRVADNIAEWSSWCRAMGKKLLDDSITIDQINKWFVIPEQLTSRPNLAALDMDWSDQLYQQAWDRARIKVGGHTLGFFDIPILLEGHSKVDPIRFIVLVNDQEAVFEVKFGREGPYFEQIAGQEAFIEQGKAWKSLASFFDEYPPTIYFEGEAILDRGLLQRPRRESRVRFDRTILQAWTWTGVNIRKESQGLNRDPDSIQARVIHKLLEEKSYDIVFDDDDKNEVADIVCLKRTDTDLIIDLYHCKYSSSDSAGARLDDLYEVCGQSQKSVRWRERVGQLLSHLREREGRRKASGGLSRLQSGTAQKLVELIKAEYLLMPRVSINIVQPGVSKSKATAEMLELLGATENYLKETYQIPLGVICSD